MCNEALEVGPFDPTVWNYRSNVHLKLAYPELAFTDAARGLQLLDDKRLAGATLAENERLDSLLFKIDTLYSCLLAAEGLKTPPTALHCVERLLTNSHLLSAEALETLRQNNNHSKER